MAGGHAWWGACMAGGHAWWGACMAGGVLGRGACVAGGACMAGGACVVGGGIRGRGHVWLGEGGPCVAGETATAAGGMHPTGMHSSFLSIILASLSLEYNFLLFLFCVNFYGFFSTDIIYFYLFLPETATSLNHRAKQWMKRQPESCGK